MARGPYSYGRSSQAVLATLHHDLQIILTDVIEIYDVQLLEGARTVEQQIRNIRKGVSKTIDSRHIPRTAEGVYDPNAPAMAVDMVPYLGPNLSPWPAAYDSDVVRQKKAHRFYFMQGIVYTIARGHKIEIVQGVDWDNDADFFDQSFDDLPHVELAKDLPPLILGGDLLAEANEALRARGLREWRNGK